MRNKRSKNKLERTEQMISKQEREPQNKWSASKKQIWARLEWIHPSQASTIGLTGYQVDSRIKLYRLDLLWLQQGGKNKKKQASEDKAAKEGGWLSFRPSFEFPLISLPRFRSLFLICGSSPFFFPGFAAFLRFSPRFSSCSGAQKQQRATALRGRMRCEQHWSNLCELLFKPEMDRISQMGKYWQIWIRNLSLEGAEKIMNMLKESHPGVNFTVSNVQTEWNRQYDCWLWLSSLFILLLPCRSHLL